MRTCYEAMRTETSYDSRADDNTARTTPYVVYEEVSVLRYALREWLNTGGGQENLVVYLPRTTRRLITGLRLSLWVRACTPDVDQNRVYCPHQGLQHMSLRCGLLRFETMWESDVGRSVLDEERNSLRLPRNEACKRRVRRVTCSNTKMW